MDMNLKKFFSGGDYDPVELVNDHPSLAHSIANDHPDRADEIYIKMIDVSKGKYLATIAEERLTETVKRRINKLKLTKG